MRRAPLVMVALVAALAVTTVSACTPSNDGIGIDSVNRATVTEVVDVPASVTAKGVATLTAPADGTLTKLAVAPGAAVKRGAVLAVIDSPDARKRLADAKAALSAASGYYGGGSVNLTGAQEALDSAADDAFASARAAAEQVADEKVRNALLKQIDAATKHYNQAAATARQVVGQVQRGLAGIGQAVAALGAAQRAQAQAAYDLAKSTVDALTLRAPIAGIVQYASPTAGTSADPLASLLGAVGGGSASSASTTTSTDTTVAGVDDVLSVGDRVSAGTPVVTIVDVSQIGLVGEVDETDVLLVAPGVKAAVELDAAPGVRFAAIVNTVDLLPTPSARGGVAYRVRLSFTPVAKPDAANPPPTPRPGMSAVAHLAVRTATDAVSVPAAAVFTVEGGGDAVWLVRNGHAVRQTVRLGVQGEDLVQILSGLSTGDRIVVNGADKVSADQDLT